MNTAAEQLVRIIIMLKGGKVQAVMGTPSIKFDIDVVNQDSRECEEAQDGGLLGMSEEARDIAHLLREAEKLDEVY